MWQYNKFKRKKKQPKQKASSDKPTGPKKPNYVDQLDRVFSLYIRLRDALPNGMVKCISCGKYFPFAQVDCGHFYSRIHTATRWDEDNCHAECRYCNRMSAEHLIGYRANLVKKIGEQRVALLEVKAHQTVKRDEYVMKLLIEDYKKKVKVLLEEKNI